MNLFLAFLITAFINMIFPFIRFYKQKGIYTKTQIKKFLILNGLLIMIADIILVNILYPNLLIVKSGVTEILYFCVNSMIYLWWYKISREDNPKIKISIINDKKRTKRNNNFLKDLVRKKAILIIVFLGIIVFAGLYFYKINENGILLNQIEYLKNENDSLNAKLKNIKNRDIDLDFCITMAKTNREALWKANCPESNSNCSLSQDIIKWIDSRYESDINVCKIKYN